MAAIKNMDQLLKKLERFPELIMKAINESVEKTVLKAEADARVNAPANQFSQATSNGAMSLRQSITHELDPLNLKGRVVAKAPHAAFVEFGTGPVGAANHEGISPHVNPVYTMRKSWVYPIYDGGKANFKFLKSKVRKVFRLKSKGVSFVTTSGQPARPFMYPAAVDNKSTFEKNTEQALMNAIREVAGK